MEIVKPYQIHPDSDDVALLSTEGYTLTQTKTEYAIADLTKRYEIGKAAIYNRLHHLGIEPHKLGRNAYIWGEELEFMDALHAHISGGGFLSDFGGHLGSYGLRLVPGVHSPAQEVHLDTSIVAPSPKTTLPNPLAITLQQLPDPLAPHRQLREVAEQGWQITTSQLRAIIGVHPSGRVWYGSFRLKQMGRIGREHGWYVEKVD